MTRLQETGGRIAVSQPLYRQVSDLLLTRVQRGEWGAGETLPNELVLASEFQVSVGTIRRAVEGLERAGLLVRKQGRGTFVLGTNRSAMLDRFNRLTAGDGAAGEPRHRLLGIKRRPAAPDESLALECDKSQEVLEVEQLLDCDGLTIGHERSVLVAERLPQLETQMAYGQPIFGVLVDYGIIIGRVRDVLSAVAAGDELSDTMQTTRGQPLLKMERTAYAIGDQPVELRVAHYATDILQYACDR